MQILLKRNDKIIARYRTRKTTAHNLKLMGYNPQEVEKIVNEIRKDEETTIEV